jgi:hypothetical protein
VAHLVVPSPSTREHQNVARARPLHASPATLIGTLARSAPPLALNLHRQILIQWLR